MKEIPVICIPLLEAWRAPQVLLPQVVRWKKYIDKDEGARIQNSLEHSHAITILGAIAINRLRPHLFLDEGLLLTAFAIHDVGEGEVGKDTLYLDKTVEGDLAEYLAFRKRYASLGSAEFEFLERAFLLQFAAKNPAVFSPRTRAIMFDLASNRRFEVMAFEAVERWDYVLYALEQYRERGNAKILVQTLRNQMPSLRNLAEAIPGFRQTVWTVALESWAADFVEAHEGRWIEQKGER